MIYQAVIDTNVLVSALLSKHEDAATVQLVSQIIAGRLTPVYSSDIISEYREVLSRKKFHFSTETVNYLLSAIKEFGILVEPISTGEVLPDEKDIPFFEVVMAKREDEAYLVTGNLKHFPSRPYIVTAREMLDILNAAF